MFIYPIDKLVERITFFKEQQDFGVDVYIADPTQGLSPHLKQDYLIVDDSFAIQSIFGSDGQVANNKLTIEKREVFQLSQDFNKLMSYAVPLDGVLDELHQAGKL